MPRPAIDAESKATSYKPSKDRCSSPKGVSGFLDSRPALVNKPLNVASPSKDKESNLKRQKFEEYLLTHTRGSSLLAKQNEFQEIGHSSGLKIKSEFESVKTDSNEAIGTPLKRPTKASSSSLAPNAVSGSNGPKKKKLKSAEKFKKMVGSSEIFGGLDKTNPLEPAERVSLEKPGKYSPIVLPLYEPQNATDWHDKGKDDLFQDIEQEAEKEYCQTTSNLSLSEWIVKGQGLLNSQTTLIGELIQKRIELSNKFRAITTVINERAEALNIQGQILDEKLNKIRSLGKEILNII